MCIALIKPAGAKIPSKETLERCFIANPDGAGISVPDIKTNSFIIRKGFFEFDEFYEVILKEVKVNELAFIHMRIATHGDVDKGNCHPFPVCDDYELMRGDELVECQQVMMHNGILSLENEIDKVSDTMTFNKAIYQAGIDVFQPTSKFLIDCIIEDCRVAYMRFNNKRAEWIKFGDTWEEYKGVWYSNQSYKKPLYPSYTTMGGYKKWNYGTVYGQTSVPDTYSSSPYKMTREELLPEDVEQVGWGLCPYTDTQLDSNYQCKSSQLDFSPVKKWLDKATMKEMELSGLSDEFIKDWWAYKTTVRKKISKS